MPSPVLNVEQATRSLRAGQVIAYPTEAVYGLGCDPENEEAVQALLGMKQRSITQGLILITDRYERLAPFVAEPGDAQMQLALESWPGPVTWIFPKSGRLPPWISGDHDSVAVRVTAHPVCRALCSAFGGAIVSTSANISTGPPALSHDEVDALFEGKISGIVAGSLGGLERPSEIRDIRTEQVIRKG